jgi:DNA helicase II / ATP-dependent DNA helicase PcrA
MIEANLSPAQQSAVCHIGTPAIVTAGAGSGKTKTLTSKIAFLVNELVYDPGKILAITFTNKAADEMKARLVKITGRPVRDFPWVRTFHSACFKILKDHCHLLGYRKPLTIHADYQQKAHLKKVLAELSLDKKYLYAATGMISKAKNSGHPYAYLDVSGRVPRRKELYRRYNELLELSNSVDFDDILLLTRDLLTKFPEIRRQYQQVFDYILVDEFQDSNTIQNEIIALLVKNGNLTVVGDDYQSIYKFRGADPAHFINFPTVYKDARVFKLEQNYRSTDSIVAAADAVIANNMQRMAKHCFSDRQGEPIQFKRFYDEYSEAAWVAEKCREYINYQKVPVEQIAILYRTKFTSLSFERALRSGNVHYTMVGAQGFFQRREVQDINAYLISAVNPRDDVSFERIINVPRRGIGPGAISKIIAARKPDTSLQDACRQTVKKNILPKKSMAALEKLLNFLFSIKEMPPDGAIRKVMTDMEYDEYLKSFAENLDDYDSRRENIAQLIYSASQKATIADYLEDAALIREDQDQEENLHGIRLSTIHAAKGLEFKVVFLVTLEEGILPHHRSVGKEDEEEENNEGVEEERRLMYVAMTRASDHLHLTWSLTRRGEPSRPSRFLKEIPESLLCEA